MDLGLTLDHTVLDIITELEQMPTKEIGKHYCGRNFNWEEKRYYTEDELNDRAQKENDIAMEIINNMMETGEL